MSNNGIVAKNKRFTRNYTPRKMATSTIVEEFVRRQGQHHFHRIKCDLIDELDFEEKISYCTTLSMFWAKALQSIAIAMKDNAASDLEYNDLGAAAGLFEDTACNAKLAAEQLNLAIKATKVEREYVMSLMEEIKEGLERQDINPRFQGEYKIRVMTHLVKLHLGFIGDFIDKYRQKLDLAVGRSKDEEEIKNCLRFINVLKNCFSGFMEMEYQLID